MTTNDLSLRSPKNKFRCEINLKNALEEIGSVISFNANTIEAVKVGIKQKSEMIQRAGGANIVIRENKKIYPEFEWVIIEIIEK